MKNNILISLALCAAGLVCVTYGVNFVRIGVVPYQYLDSMAVFEKTHGKHVLFSPLPKDAYVQSQWRRSRALPPRVHVRYFEFRWPGFNETTEDLLWDQTESGRADSAAQLNRMYCFRIGEFFTRQGVSRPYLAIVIAGCTISVCFFLLISGCIRAWFALNSTVIPRSKHHLLSSTTFSVSVVCFFSRYVFVSWMLVHPVAVRESVRSYYWNPDGVLLDLSRTAQVPAAWSILIALVCSFGLFAIASALFFAAHEDESMRRLALVYLRVVVWFQVPITLVYLIYCFVFQAPLSPMMLLPDPWAWGWM